MKIRNVRHRGLRQLIEIDDPSGLPSAFVEKIRNIISFLQDMSDVDELRSMQSWRVHQLTDDRRGTWSLSVTRNWRITFCVDFDQIEILDLD